MDGCKPNNYYLCLVTVAIGSVHTHLAPTIQTSHNVDGKHVFHACSEKLLHANLLHTSKRICITWECGNLIVMHSQ